MCRHVPGVAAVGFGEMMSKLQGGRAALVSTYNFLTICGRQTIVCPSPSFQRPLSYRERPLLLCVARSIRYIPPSTMSTRNENELDFAQDLDFSEILTNPILDIAARFWEEDRYEAFQVCYRSMRKIDDLVDDRKEVGEDITPKEMTEIRDLMLGWLEAARQGDRSNPFLQDFLKTLDHFALPLWPWERLCVAMSYDLDHNGFANFRAFLRYTEGAAIAPASVFMHLCGVTRTGSGYTPPAYDIREAARPLAIFSYLVHIMRDFQKDHMRGLNYFAEDGLARFDLSVDDLADMARKGEVTPQFRKLIARYVGFAEYYRARSRRTIDAILPYLAPRYQLSFEMIYSLYMQIFERIDPNVGNFTTAETNPSPSQVNARIEDTVQRFRAVPTC